MDCIFCKIVNGDIPSNKVYADDTVLGEGEDPFAQNTAHLCLGDRGLLVDQL